MSCARCDTSLCLKLPRCPPTRPGTSRPTRTARWPSVPCPGTGWSRRTTRGPSASGRPAWPTWSEACRQASAQLLATFLYRILQVQCGNSWSASFVDIPLLFLLSRLHVGGASSDGAFRVSCPVPFSANILFSFKSTLTVTIKKCIKTKPLLHCVQRSACCSSPGGALGGDLGPALSTDIVMSTH